LNAGVVGLGAKEPVSGISKARDDVALVVEAAIDAGDVYVDAGMGRVQPGDALRGGDEPQILDPVDARPG
jgi:hypothetical protein